METPVLVFLHLKSIPTRTLLKVTADINAGNAALADDSLERIIEQTIDLLKPECSFFYTEHGNRACFMVFDLKDVADIPSISEPLFTHLNAHVVVQPGAELRRTAERAEGRLQLQAANRYFVTAVSR